MVKFNVLALTAALVGLSQAVGQSKVTNNCDSSVYLWVEKVAQRRAFLSTYDGVLMVNLDAPEAPFAQAFLRTWYWGSNVPRIIDDEVYLPAGPSGIQQIGIDDSNLLQSP